MPIMPSNKDERPRPFSAEERECEKLREAFMRRGRARGVSDVVSAFLFEEIEAVRAEFRRSGSSGSVSGYSSEDLRHFAREEYWRMKDGGR